MDLIEAAKKGDLETVKRLLAEGADPDRRDAEGRTALDVAIEEKNTEAVALLRATALRPRGVQRRWQAPDTPTRRLYAAIRKRDAAAVAAALADGAEPDVVPAGETATPLGLAGAEVEIVKLLLDAGADPDDGGARPPLVAAAQKLSLHTRDALGTMALLLEAGADVDATDRNGLAALHHAATRRPEGVRLLLRAGADPTLRDTAGRTPREFAELMLEFQPDEGQREAVALLVAAEAGKLEIEETFEALIGGAENPVEALREGLGALAKFGEQLLSTAGEAAADAAQDDAGVRTGDDADGKKAERLVREITNMLQQFVDPPGKKGE